MSGIVRLSEGVEWAIHCCTVLAALPAARTMPSATLAEFHEVPPAYLAKHLQAITAAGMTESVPGPRGGYRLARPPAEISVLEVVLAVDGGAAAFRCREIRQRGPAAGAPDTYLRPCGIARVMWRAEHAWRAALAATSIGDLVTELRDTGAPEQLLRATEWIQEVEITRRNRR